MYKERAFSLLLHDHFHFHRCGCGCVKKAKRKKQKQQRSRCSVCARAATALMGSLVRVRPRAPDDVNDNVDDDAER